ncbi:MAG: HipA domain-containing protein [Flavobacteriales bacterium]|nr:HipA domain-containing protein [Flavobacteriales bacterium]
MSELTFTYCPGTLAENKEKGFSKTALKRVFYGKKVSPILPYALPAQDEATAEQFLENRKRISISGVQEKLSLLLDKNKLRLTKENEQGTFILKPIPRDLRNAGQLPANEHLTMQIARQVYGIPTAENALVFFKDHTPAYITKRFDVKPDGSKWGKEDFASLSGRSAETYGRNFKYGLSYEELAELIKQYVPAYAIEREKFFKLVVFNYLFSNGDAHLKNFSLIETPEGDYQFAPAYDLVNTQLHVDDSDFALDGGLFKDDFESVAMKKSGHHGNDDFLELAKRMGISDKRAVKLLAPFLAYQEAIEEMINRSYLDAKTKRGYLQMYSQRRNQLIAK